MLTALNVWEREERTLPWAQTLQKVHPMEKQRPYGVGSHARHQVFPPLICNLNLGENVLPFLHWGRWKGQIKHTVSQTGDAGQAKPLSFSLQFRLCFP